jgi:hypothetical protein
VSGGQRLAVTRGLLVLADISGYTEFLQAVDGAHGAQMATMTEPPPAYPLMTSFLNGIVGSVVPPFTLSKLEGDAVFVYAPHDDLFELRGTALLDCVRQCHESYRERRDATDNLMLCSCDACSLLQRLELKFVLHYGEFVVQSIAGREELLGPDVTMAHLLLKNSVAKVLGRASYALLTAPAASHFEVPLDDALAHTEHYDHYPPMETHVFTL